MEIENTKNYKNSTFYKLWKIALPIIILGFANASYIFIDSLFAQIFIDNSIHDYNPASIISLFSPLINVLQSILLISVVGISLAVSRKIGEKNNLEGEKIIGNNFLIVVLLGTSIFLFSFFIAKPWMNFIGGKVDLGIEGIKAGVNYIKIISPIFLFLSFRDSIIRILRVEEKGIFAAIIPISAIPINLFFDWLFMGALDFGIEGAAWATFISIIFTFLFSISYSFYLRNKNKTLINFSYKNFKLEKKHVYDIFKFGTNSFIRRFFNSILGISLTFFVISLAPENNIYKSEIVRTDWASYLTATNRTLTFLTIAALSVAQSSSILISLNIGQKNNEEVKKILKLSFFSIILLEIISSLFLLIFVKDILEVFKVLDNGNDKRFVNAFYITLSSIPLLTLQLIPMVFYASTQDIKRTTLHSFINLLIGILVFILFYFVIFKNTKNSDLFFISFVVIGLLQNLITLPIFITGYKKLKKNIIN